MKVIKEEHRGFFRSRPLHPAITPNSYIDFSRTALPHAELLNSIHWHASHYYTSEFRSAENYSLPSDFSSRNHNKMLRYDMFHSLDNSALVGIGVLLQELARYESSPEECEAEEII